MLLLTATLFLLLAAALFVAARELVGFRPDPAWQDVGKLRERLLSPIPPAPHRMMAGRGDRVRFCLDLQREFQTAWRLCRFLAPIVGEPGYVGRLLRAKLKFDLTLLVALAAAATGARQTCNVATERLRELGTAIRVSALDVLCNDELGHSASAA